MLLKVKAECTLDAPALTVFDFFKDFASEKKINSMIQDYSVISDSTRDDYQELHIFQKMPFPLNNRDLVRFPPKFIRNVFPSKKLIFFSTYREEILSKISFDKS